jgi:hypothetical protein
MTRPPNDRDRELDALLRQPGERLSPPDGSWALVTKRARRRKWAKASLSIAAVIVVIAGAVPAIIAVRGNSNDQKLIESNPVHRTSTTPKTTPKVTPDTAASGTPSPSPTVTPTIVGTPTVPIVPTGPVAPPALDNFTPTSVSFVSQRSGWLWGATGRGGLGRVAHTMNAGQNWTTVGNTPAVLSTAPGGDGDWGIRFATGVTGYVFGTKQYVTTDTGATWTQFTVPNLASDDPVVDIEALAGKVWALACSQPACTSLTLYGTSNLDPTGFTAVPGLSSITGSGGSEIDAGSITLNGTAVYVSGGGRTLWTSRDGQSFTTEQLPCSSGTTATDPLSAWRTTGLAVLCSHDAGPNGQTSTAYRSSDGGLNWKPLHPAKPGGGFSLALSAALAGTVEVGTTNAASRAYTIDSGGSWSQHNTDKFRMSYVGFINRMQVVALPDPAQRKRGFLMSYDGGGTWTLTQFPR